tara:strand:+ start:402 stop:623 length:222 start_codon:yes stop_codon:yes gene_type:complete
MKPKRKIKQKEKYYKISEEELNNLKESVVYANYSLNCTDPDKLDQFEKEQTLQGLSNLSRVLQIIQNDFEVLK